MADIITQTEDDIVAQLRDNVEDCRIDNDPKRTQAAPIARALVFHTGENPGMATMDGRSQPTELQFSVDLQLADQRIGSHQKVYPIINSIKNALIGFSPSCGSKLEMVGNDYQEMPSDSGVRWRYLMRFTTEAVWTKS